MNKTIRPKMLVVSIMLAIFCYITTAVRGQIATVKFQPLIEKAVRSVISDYKSIVYGSGPIVYGDIVLKFVGEAKIRNLYNSVMESQHRKSYNSVMESQHRNLCNSVLEHQHEMESAVYNFLVTKLDTIIEPAQDKFMREAATVLEAAKVHAINFRVGVLVNDLVEVLKRVEEAFKEEVIDFLLKSIPDMLKIWCEVAVEVVSNEAYNGPKLQWGAVAPFEAIGNIFGKLEQLEKEQMKAMLYKSIPNVIQQALRSNVAHNNPAEGKKWLEKHLSSEMNGDSSIVGYKLISEFFVWSLT